MSDNNTTKALTTTTTVTALKKAKAEQIATYTSTSKLLNNINKGNSWKAMEGKRRKESKGRGPGRPRKSPKMVYFSAVEGARFEWTPSKIYFEVAGMPVPKARAALRSTSSRRVYYNPSQVQQEQFAAILKDLAALYLPKESELKANRQQLFKCRIGFYFPTGTNILQTADVDNLSKFVLDSLNKITYYDDRQVVSLHATKEVSESSDVGRTIVELSVAS